MSSCSIKWCDKNSRTSSREKDGISFYKYPKDPSLKKKWIKATKRENWSPTAYSVICSRHFTEDCYKQTKDRRCLLTYAVPTLYLPILSGGYDSKIKIPVTSLTEIQTDDDSHSEMRNSSDTETKSPGKSIAQIVPKSEKRKPIAKQITSSQYDKRINKRLCRRIVELSDNLTEKNRQIKNLKAKNEYLKKRIVSLKLTNKEFKTRLGREEYNSTS